MSAFQGAMQLSLVLSSDDEATLGGTEDVTRSVDSNCEKGEESIDANRYVGVQNKKCRSRGSFSLHEHTIPFRSLKGLCQLIVIFGGVCCVSQTVLLSVCSCFVGNLEER
eukprot:scaffold4707_cov164-Amphora_coffeaeformis.AAC.23